MLFLIFYIIFPNLITSIGFFFLSLLVFSPPHTYPTPISIYLSFSFSSSFRISLTFSSSLILSLALSFSFFSFSFFKIFLFLFDSRTLSTVIRNREIKNKNCLLHHWSKDIGRRCLFFAPPWVACLLHRGSDGFCLFFFFLVMIWLILRLCFDWDWI